MEPLFICVTGFLGSGKTTFLNRLLPVALDMGKTAVIENDFGAANVDAVILQNSGAQLRELASGCVCCTLGPELERTLQELSEPGSDNVPRVIFLEPSGISCTSDLLPKIRHGLRAAACDTAIPQLRVITLVDGSQLEENLESFGAFFSDQIVMGEALFVSHVRNLAEPELQRVHEVLHAINPAASLFCENWMESNGSELMDFIVSAPQMPMQLPRFSKQNQMERLTPFTAWTCGEPQPLGYSALRRAADCLRTGSCGTVLRAKGFCKDTDGHVWLLNYVPGSCEISAALEDARLGISVIGHELNEQELAGLFSGKVSSSR